MNSLEFYVFHNSAYPPVPHKSVIAKHSRTNYVSLPNTFYDKAIGQRVLEDLVDVFVLSERLGYDGIAHAEQHNSPIGLGSANMVTTAYLAARTERILIVADGPILNAYLTPVRLAEEVAQADILSHGRLILGLPMGLGAQYHSYGVTDPSTARARFNEGHELLIRAMTESGPFEFQGEFFHVPYVNLWPRPVQDPHPPIWIPAAGSRETLERCARSRYTYQAVLTPREVLKKNCKFFREACQKEGYEADPKQIVSVFLVHVAETDAQARREAEPHILWLFQNLFRSTFQDAFAPGHVSETSLRGMMSGGYRSRDISAMSWEELVEAGWLIAGSPDTVAEQLEERTDELRSGRVLMWVDHGSAPTWMIHKNLTLFAEEVMPRFRGQDGKPIWARQDLRQITTASEASAISAGAKAVPAAEVYGHGIVDVRTSHVPELNQPIDLRKK